MPGRPLKKTAKQRGNRSAVRQPKSDQDSQATAATSSTDLGDEVSPEFQRVVRASSRYRKSDHSSSGAQAARAAGSLSDPRHSTQALFMSMSRILRDPSKARRESRENSKAMRSDPRIEKCLRKRKLATLGLNFSIMPEDEKDEGQQDAAKVIDGMVRSFDFEELIENALEAIWYGSGPCELMVGFDDRDRVFRVLGTRSIHGDSLVFNVEGEPFIRVGAGYKGNDWVSAFESRARPLSTAERDILFLHTYNPAAPDYFDPQESGLIFHGQGLREDVFYPWLFSHKMHMQWVYFLERYAGGIVIIVHADTDAARDAAEDAVRDYKDGNFILMPVHGDAVDIKAFDVQIKEAPSNTANLYYQYVEEFTGRLIQHAIEGQELTSNVGPTGLGSGLSKTHMNTFQMFVEYDARRLARTLTEQLVWRLQAWNGIMPEARLRWQFSMDDVNIAEQMSAVQAAYMMGVTFKANEVRELTGLSKPDDDDEIVGNAMMLGDEQQEFAFGENGQNGTGGRFGSLSDNIIAGNGGGPFE